MLVAAIVAWTFVNKRSTTIDDVLTDPSDDRAVGDMVKRALGWKAQATAPVVLATASVPFLLLVSSPMKAVVDVGLPSYISLFITMAIGANVEYWLFAGPFLMVFILRRPKLALRWNNPSTTPAMRMMADTCAMAAIFLLLGALSISVLGFIIPQTNDVPILLWTLIAFFSLTVVTIVWLVFVPLSFIYRVCNNSIRVNLSKIRPALPKSAEAYIWLHTDSQTELLDLYDRLSSAPRLPFSTGTVVQYGAALLSTVVAFVVSIR